MKSNLLLTLLICCFINSFSQSIDWHVSANPLGLQTNSVQYSSNGLKVLSGTDCHPAKIRIYSGLNGNLEWDYTVSSNLLCIMGVGFGSNGNYIAAIEEFGNLLIFDNTVSPPDSINTISIGTTYAFSLDFSPDNRKIAVGGNNGKLIICSVDSGRVLHTVTAHANWVTTVNYDPNNQFLVTGGSDFRVKIWDTTGGNIATLSGHTGHLTKVLVSNDGSKIYSSSKDNTVKIWDVATKSLLRTIPVSNSDVNSIALSPSNNHLVTVSSDSIIRVYETALGQLIDSIFEPLHGFGLSVDWSSSKNQIAVGTKKGRVVAYSVQGMVSLEEESNPINISLFPNPAQDFIQLKSTTQEVDHYELYSLSGKLVQNGKIFSKTQSIDISSLKSGSYIIKVFNKNQAQLQSIKMIKE